MSDGLMEDIEWGFKQETHRTNRFLFDLKDEVKRAREKFPGRKHMLAALTEEVGELAQALIDHERSQRDITGHTAIYKEAIQVAAMALRIATEGDDEFQRFVPPQPKQDACVTVEFQTRYV